MKVYGELKRAQLELTDSPIAALTGQVTYNKTTDNAVVCDGTTSRQIFDSGAKIKLNTNYVNDADYTILDDDNYVVINVTTGASDRTITLPTLVDNIDRVIIINKVDSGAGKVIIDGEGAETIDGQSTYELFENYDSVSLLGNSICWAVIAKKYNDIVTIQDYTEVKSIGETDQQFAGRDYTLAELQDRFSSDLLAYWNFPDTNIGDDTTGTYDLTGVNVDDTNNTTGIMNDDFGVELNGTDEYLNNGTLLDTVPSAIAYSCWFKADDGQPANISYLMGKHNNSTAGSAEDFFRVGIKTTGLIAVRSEENDNGEMEIASTTRLPNTATGWHHVVACWDTTYGLRLYVNGLLEAQDASATTLMANGTDSQFTIGARDIEGTINFYFDGKIANAIVLNKTMTQADVDFLYATTIPLPTHLQGRNFNLRGKYKDSGNDVRTFTPDIVAIEDERILRNGGGFKSDDEIKFMGAL